MNDASSPGRNIAAALRETFETRQRVLLEGILAGRPAWVVTHPYPVDLAALFESVRPVLR